MLVFVYWSICILFFIVLGVIGIVAIPLLFMGGIVLAMLAILYFVISEYHKSKNPDNDDEDYII